MLIIPEDILFKHTTAKNVPGFHLGVQFGPWNLLPPVCRPPKVFQIHVLPPLNKFSK